MPNWPEASQITVLQIIVVTHSCLPMQQLRQIPECSDYVRRCMSGCDERAFLPSD